MKILIFINFVVLVFVIINMLLSRDKREEEYKETKKDLEGLKKLLEHEDYVKLKKELKELLELLEQRKNCSCKKE